MIRTIISDIGNVLSGFIWYDFYKSKGYSEEMVERLAKATVGSDIWKEYDRGVLSEEEILNRFIANDPELEEDLHKTLANVRGIMKRYDYAIPWIEELKAKGYQFLVKNLCAYSQLSPLSSCLAHHQKSQFVSFPSQIGFRFHVPWRKCSYL